MSIETELSAKVYHLMTLYEEFSDGKYEEMNGLYSDDFQGWLYMPRVGNVELFDVEKIRLGNEEAANYYKGKKVRFVFSGLKIVPQSAEQAAVS